VDIAAIQEIIPQLNSAEGAMRLLAELGYGDFLEPEPLDCDDRYWHVERRDTRELEPIASSACMIATPASEGRLYSYFYELKDDCCDRFGRIKISAFRPIAQKHYADTGVPLLFFAPPEDTDSDEIVLATFTRVGKIEEDDRIALRWVRFHRDEPSARTPMDVATKLEYDSGKYLREIVLSAFALEPLTDSFYEEYRQIFENLKAKLVKQLKGGKEEKDQRAHEFASLLMNRLMFLWFVQKKGWLDGRQDYLLKLFDGYDGDKFYADRIQPVFEMLNNPKNEKLRAQFKENYGFDPGQLPFLNGGLFDELEMSEQTSRDKKTIEVGNRFFRDIFHNLFAKYNFTVEESTPLNIEIAVDPEMLGHVFERMVTGRHESGSYYTPKGVVNFMCKEAIKGYLKTTTRETSEALSALVEGGQRNELRDYRQVSNMLEKMRVCDPACGSGAYLLGMMHNLILLQQALYGSGELHPSTVHSWKLEMISRNIYGVDIDTFAVSIAKLRLWLSLVVDETRDPLGDDRPDVALPNLEFKIETGDSLTAPNPTDKEYTGDIFEQELLKLADELGELKDRFLQAHDGKAKRELRERIIATEKRLTDCIEAERKLPENAFDWRIQFAEVFRHGGFDIVIANPPYVRQQQIEKSFKNILGEVYPEFPKRSDLFVYFYARALQLLKKGGFHIFVCSNSWLDVGYGAALQEYLLDNAYIHAIFDSAVERQFSSASINTIVSIIQKGKPKVDAETRFVLLKDEFQKAIENYIAETDDKTYRMRTFTQKEMREGGSDPDSGKYVGDKWGGKYLRAPDIYWKILEKAGDKLVRLGDIAEIRRGFTTGANDFFYLEPTGESAPKGLMHVKNGAGWEGFIEEEYLKPVVKSPREVKTIKINPDDLRYRVFMCHKSKKELKGTKALEYIEWGEEQGYHERPTCASRKYWWDLGNSITGDIAYPERQQARFFFAMNPKQLPLNKSFYGVYSKKPIVLISIIQNHLYELFAEINARTPGGGGGPLDIDVKMAENSLIVNPSIIPKKYISKAEETIKSFQNRSINKIFQELGLPKPNRDLSNIRPEEVSLAKVLPDRRELDRIVFEAIGLSEVEQLEVYRAVVELVKNRLVKAKSISGATKKSERTGGKTPSERQESVPERPVFVPERAVEASESPVSFPERVVEAPEGQESVPETAVSSSERPVASSENVPEAPESGDFRLRSGDKGEQKRIEYPDMKSHKGRGIKVTLDEKSKKLGETTVKLLREKRDIIVDSVAPIDLAPEGRNARYEFFMEHMLAAIRKGKAYTQNELLRATLQRLRGKDNVRLTEKMRAELEPVLKKAIREGLIEKTGWVDEYRKV